MPPESLNSIEYLTQLRRGGYHFHQPLAKYGLYDPFVTITDMDGCAWVNTKHTDYFDEYVIAVATAQDNMSSQFNPNPPHPRLFSTIDVVIKEALRQFFVATDPLYEAMEGRSVQQVQSYRHSRISWGCHQIDAGNDSRKVLVKKYKR